MRYEESARKMAKLLDVMKSEPCKSPFDEAVIDFLEVLAFEICIDRPEAGAR